MRSFKLLPGHCDKSGNENRTDLSIFGTRQDKCREKQIPRCFGTVGNNAPTYHQYIKILTVCLSVRV